MPRRAACALAHDGVERIGVEGAHNAYDRRAAKCRADVGPNIR